MIIFFVVSNNFEYAKMSDLEDQKIVSQRIIERRRKQLTETHNKNYVTCVESIKSNQDRGLSYVDCPREMSLRDVTELRNKGYKVEEVRYDPKWHDGFRFMRVEWIDDSKLI